MAHFYPFHALMPTPEKVSRVAAVPYDVVNSEEAAVLAEGNPLSFLRVSRPEIELAPGVDLYSDEVYAKAESNFRRLCKEAPLVHDREANLYVYSLKMGDHVQLGLAGAASAEDYDKNIIKKHEKTRKDKEDDRARHVMTLRNHSGPVFLAYRDSSKIDSLVAEVMKNPPFFSFTAPDGIEHKLWKCGEAMSKEISAVFENEIPCFYIADGHHRAASASRAAASCKAANPAHTGKEDYNFFLAVAFPASQLKILPYNRVVHDLNGLSPEAFLAAVGEKFTITPAASPEPAGQGTFCMYFQGKWSLLSPKFDLSALGVIQKLDVSILQDNVLSPILGITDPRTSKRISFIGGIRGTAELEKLVNSGKGAVAFSMYPTTMDQLFDIADAGEIMPPKSTWFEPKLRDGLVTHSF
ncbi:MAG: DUF1015 domain-containing protein [Lentisphaeria bacterium]|nr:DUF1015 domain-containing protein [Lentisphaeria bacterium]